MVVGLVNPFLQDAEHGNLGGRVAFICESITAEEAHYHRRRIRCFGSRLRLLSGSRIEKQANLRYQLAVCESNLSPKNEALRCTSASNHSPRYRRKGQ